MTRLYRPDGWTDGRTDRWGRTDTGSVPTCGRNARIGAEVDGENRLRKCPHQYGLSPEIFFAADAYYSRSQKVVSVSEYVTPGVRRPFYFHHILFRESESILVPEYVTPGTTKQFLVPSYIISGLKLVSSPSRTLRQDLKALFC